MSAEENRIAASATPAGSRRRRAVGAVVFVFACAVGAYFAWWHLSGQYSESTDDAYVGGNIVQISPDLEEASHVSGAGARATYFRVTLPLLRPAIVYGWFYIYVMVVREYSIAVVLSVSGSTALAPLTWQTLQQGSLGHTYALSILQIALVVVVLFVARGVFGIRLGAVRSTSVAAS